jgi:hypothetical protein
LKANLRHPQAKVRAKDQDTQQTWTMNAPEPTQRAQTREIGPPMNIQATAEMLGCSTWTVRQRLIPRGLPYFQINPRGKMIFYRDQVVGWLQKQHKRPTY